MSCYTVCVLARMRALFIPQSSDWTSHVQQVFSNAKKEILLHPCYLYAVTKSPTETNPWSVTGPHTRVFIQICSLPYEINTTPNPFRVLNRLNLTAISQVQFINTASLLQIKKMQQHASTRLPSKGKQSQHRPTPLHADTKAERQTGRETKRDMPEQTGRAKA